MGKVVDILLNDVIFAGGGSGPGPTPTKIVVPDAYRFYESSHRLSGMPPEMCDFSTAKNFSYMCNSCGTIDLSSLDTRNATDMSNMFSSFSGNAITLGPKFSTENVTTFANMFYSANTTLSLVDIVEKIRVTEKATKIGSMLYSSAARWFPAGYALDLSGWDVRNVTAMNNFINTSGVTSIDFTGWDTNKATSMGQLVRCSSCTDVYIRDTELRPDGKLKFKLAAAGTGVFSTMAPDYVIHVSAQLVDTYKAAANWSAIADHIVGDLP